jgi:amidase
LQELGAAIAKTGAKVSFSARPALDEAAHYINYLELLGAALAYAYSPDKNATDREILARLNDPRIDRVWEPRMKGRTISHADWQRADNLRLAHRLAFDAFFRDWDILVTPAAAGAAFPHDQKGERFERYLTVNGKRQPEFLQSYWAGYPAVVGNPALVGPLGFVGHLPVGYQAIAGFGQDRRALAFARALEMEFANPVGLPDPGNPVGSAPNVSV